MSPTDLESKSSALTAHATRDGQCDVKTLGGLKFTTECGGNDSLPSCQEASGAPVERKSPLGYHIGWFTIIFLNIGQMIGTGIFSTTGTIMQELGSVGLSLVYWVVGLIISAASLAVYMELSSYFPNRSGSEVVYLEQAYPRPKYLFPTVFAVLTVFLSLMSSNAIVLAEYLYAATTHNPGVWELKAVAAAAMTVIVLLVTFNTRFSLLLSNAIGVVKLGTLVFISITGFVVLGGNTSVKDPQSNFHNAFAGTTHNGNGIVNALVMINFAYAGYTGAFSMVNEIKNPIPTLKKTAPVSLLIVAILYVLCNVAYFAAVPKLTLSQSGQNVASLFFTAVFGSGRAARGLNLLIALSAFGNNISVIIAYSREIRECGRQGVLPYPKLWASTYPFGTPLASYLIQWALSVFVILAVPSGDAFNFIVSVQSYPTYVFMFAMTFGVFIIRHRRSQMLLPRGQFRAWTIALLLSLAVNIFLLVMPWYPPAMESTGGYFSFWYATYCVVGIGILVVCGMYYTLWIHILPYFRRYKIRQEVVTLPCGEKLHRLVPIANSQVDEWDQRHDVKGNEIMVDIRDSIDGESRH